MISVREFVIALLPMLLLYVGLAGLVVLLGMWDPVIGFLSVILLAITSPIVLEGWFDFSSRWI